MRRRLTSCPGSHRVGALDHESKELWGSYVEGDEWRRRYPPVHPLVGIGDALLFGPHLLHASHDNTSDRPRCSLDCRWFASTTETTRQSSTCRASRSSRCSKDEMDTARPKDQRQYDGRASFRQDDDIEGLLEQHFEQFGISRREIARNFQIYTRRIFLKRFLAHYELFRMTLDLPGDIVELGVYRGATLMSWANFLEVRDMGDRAKQVIGFDNWGGFTGFDAKDGRAEPRVDKVVGGYDAGVFEQQLKEAISIFDRDRFIPLQAARRSWSTARSSRPCLASSRRTPACASA